MTSAEQLAKLSPNDRRYLSRHECAWCGMRLNKLDCAGLIENCSDEVRVKRRERCLQARRKRKS